MKYLSTLILALVAFTSFSQTQTLSGYITDPNSGESLIGVAIVSAGTNYGVTTNAYGFYSLSLPAGEHKIMISYMGYENFDTTLVLNSSTSLNIKLNEANINIKEVVVEANNNSSKIKQTSLGLETLNMKTITKLPTTLGETDVLKIIQLMPGVQPASEGSAGFNVRGGNYDQNLILLDEAVVYNPGHLFSFVSVFNDDVINDLKLYKGTMPANYGGRTSSVLDITMKEGNNQKFSGKGSLGIIASKLTIEGPLVKDKSSFMVSARRSTIDLITKPVLSMHGGSMKNNDYYFYDITAKVNYKFSDKNRLYFSNYHGQDEFTLKTTDDRYEMNVPWGNNVATLRWNHLLTNKLFMNVSVIQNSFFRDMSSVQDGFEESKYSKLTDHTGKIDLNWYTSINHKIKAGAQITNHQINSEINGNLNKKRSIETSAFISDEFELGKDLQFNIGIRYNEFNFVGAYDEYSYNEEKEPISLVKSYKNMESVQKYSNYEPRIGVRYMINKNSSLKVNYTQTSQFMHLMSNSSSAMPLDFWIPSSKYVKPQTANQFSLGYSLSFLNDSYLFTAEAYGKSMDNLIEYADDYVPSYANESELNYVFGKGTSHGLELMLKKNAGKLQGWVAYTFSNTNREFNDLNNGVAFPSNTDIPNDLTIVGTYTLNEHWSFGANFIYKSGKPFTLPTSRYYIDGELIDNYTEKNNVRLPAYHRLDISATYKPTPKYKRFSGEWVFGIYNVYNRTNATYVYLKDEGTTADNNLTTTPTMVNVSPIMPSVTYKFKF